MQIGRNDPCWCGSGKKYKKCHAALDDRIAAVARTGAEVPDHSMIKTPEQIEGIRRAGVVNAAILDAVAAKMRVGITTGEIDRIVDAETRRLGGIPAPLDYDGFPKSVCTSINNQVCHGIPSDEDVLEDGDIVNVDVTTLYEGYYADSSRMFLIGDVEDEERELVEVAHECVRRGIAAVKPWGFLGDIANVISDLADEHGYSIVHEIGGHGVGLEFHEDPWVPYVREAGQGMLLVPGMVFTIEPMVNMGVPDVFCDEDNGWTVYTEDDMPSAQWEVTVAVTETGAEVLAY